MGVLTDLNDFLDPHLLLHNLGTFSWAARTRRVADRNAFTSATTNGQRSPRCPGCQERDATIARLEQENKGLKEQLRQERERHGANASNSSLPPSQNPLGAPKPTARKKPSGRPRGGQSGHPPTAPGLLPQDQLTEPVIACVPKTCAHCQTALSGYDAMPTIHQVIELPPSTPEVREYHRHTLTCTQCGGHTRGTLPAGVPEAGYGPRLQAFVALATGCYHLSKRPVAELLNTTFPIPISLGTIGTIERRVSAALADPVAEIKAHFQRSDVAHADETSWPQQPDKSWLWVGVTAYLAIFSVRDKRDLESAKDLLGAGFAGVLVTDRYKSYHGVGRRQLCWAHLRRDWQALIDRGGSSRRIGRRLLHLTDHMFHLWHRVRDGTLSRWMFRFHMIAIRDEVGAWLRQGARCAHPRTAGTCADILDCETALWTFVTVEGVEPTNNAAERVLRQAVLWRKKSFGTRGPCGSCFVERILSVVATCRLHGRNVLEYLTAACVAAANHEPAPSLWPPDPKQ
jgi:transposase